MTTIPRTTNHALTRARVVQYAEDNLDGDARTAVLKLAGRWKHGYIPLDAVAYAIKMKQQRGDGKRRGGIKRGSQADAAAFRGEGSPVSRPPGKARQNPAAYAKAAEKQLTGGRRKSKAGDAAPSTPEAPTRNSPDGPKRKRQTSQLHRDYQAAKAEQDARFENTRDGAVRRRNPNKPTEEERRFFGEGEFAGQGQEERLTFAKFRAEAAASREHGKAEDAAWKSGMRLGATHGYRGSHKDDDADYNAAADAHPGRDDSFMGGYNDGVIAGVKKREAEQAKKKPAVSGPRPVLAAANVDRIDKAVQEGRISPRRAAQLREDLPRKAAASKARAEEAGVRETHPVGSRVDARQPGIDQATSGVVSGHTDDGMVKVSYKDRKGNTAEGRFNPSHVTVKGDAGRDAPVGTASVADAAEAKRRTAAAEDAASKTGLKPAYLANLADATEAQAREYMRQGVPRDQAIARAAQDTMRAHAELTRNAEAGRMKDRVRELERGGMSPADASAQAYRELRPSAAAPSTVAPGVGDLAAKRDARAAETPGQLYTRFQANPESLSMGELERMRGSGSEKVAKAANVEIGRRDRAQMMREGYDPDAPLGVRRDLPGKGDGGASGGATSESRAVANAPHPVGSYVITDQGNGTVTEVTGRSTTVKLNSGETINIQRGTPGHDRIRKNRSSIKPAAPAGDGGGATGTPTVTKVGNSWRAEVDDGGRTRSIRVPHNPSLSDAENRAAAARDLKRSIAREDGGRGKA